MAHIKRLLIFAHVVESGSMTAAARQLEMTPSAISHRWSPPVCQALNR